MANEREIRIIISADGSAAIAGIRGVGDATGNLASGTAGFAATLKKNWLEITAGVTGAYLAFQKVFSLMDAAAEHAERMETLDALTRRYGSSAQELTGIIAENSHGLIGLAASANVATDALAKGFSPSQVAQMASIAATMQKVSAEGMTASEAFKTLEQSITAARERGIVKLMGATIDLSSSMGKQYDAMSKAEKAQALLTAVAEQASKVQRVLGDDFDSNADKIQRFKNQIDALKLTIGDFALRVSAAMFGVVQSIAGSVSIIIGAILKLFEYSSMLTDKVGITSGAAQGWRELAEQARLSGEDLKRKAQENYDLALKGKAAAKTGSMESLGGGGGNRKAEEKEEEERLRRFLAQEKQKMEAEEEFDRIRKEAWDEYGKLVLKEQELEDKALAYRQEKTAEYFQWEAEARDKAILDEYDRVIKAEERLAEIRLDQKALLFESNMADAQSSLNAIGASEISGNLGMLGALAAGEDPYTQDFNRWKQLQDEKLSYMAVIGATEAEWDAAFKDEALRREEMQNQQKVAMASNTFGMMAGLATALYNAQGQQGGAAFEMMKAFRIGETVMNTYSAAVGAYNALASIPYVGPALGAAAAAAAIAFGMAQVSAIASMKPGSKGSGGAVGSISQIGMGSAPANTNEVSQEKAPASPIINVHVYGNVYGDPDQIGRELAPYIVKAQVSGVR